MPAKGLAFSLYINVFNSMQTVAGLSIDQNAENEERTKYQRERPRSVSEEHKEDGLFLIHLLDTLGKCY